MCAENFYKVKGKYRVDSIHGGGKWMYAQKSMKGERIKRVVKLQISGNGQKKNIEEGNVD